MIQKWFSPLIGALMAAALCMAGCSNPLDQPEQNLTVSGAGTVQISLAGTSPRTLLPKQGPALSYTIEATKGSDAPQTINDWDGNSAKTLTLETGTWTITVTGYVTEGAAQEAISQGSATDVEITAGGTKNVPITLSRLEGEDGTGTLVYGGLDVGAIDLIALQSAALTLEPVADGTPQTKDLKSDYTAASKISDLAAGYYILTVRLVKPGDLSAAKSEVVHIYKDRTTKIADSTVLRFADDDFTHFVAVTGITDVPTAATVGTPLTLTGTIAPTDATNQTIVWSVKDAGTTGASISDENKLTATAAGTVKVTATIAGGQAVGTDYTQDFDITVADPFIAVTNITGVPAAMWVNTLLTLTSTVAPANATNKTIVWSVKDVGTTSASISDENKLTATAAGTATVTATIANGSAQGTDYTQDFTIKVTADLTWMAATVSSSGFGTTTNINGVAYGGSGTSARFIAVGDSGKMASSLNGTSWTAVSNSRFGTANIGGVAYGGGKFVAGKGDGNTNLTIASSTSGTSWTLANLATNPNYTVVNNMAYINSTFVAGGIGSIGYSSDGTTDWDVYGIGVSNSISINGVAYGGPAGQEQWVAVGNNGTMRYASSLTVTWASTYGSTIFDTTNVNGVAYGGSGTSARFIAVGDSGKMASSLNGRLWTTVSDSTFGTTNIRGVAYGGGKFVAFGANGKIAYSNLQE